MKAAITEMILATSIITSTLTVGLVMGSISIDLNPSRLGRYPEEIYSRPCWRYLSTLIRGTKRQVSGCPGFHHPHVSIRFENRSL